MKNGSEHTIRSSGMKCALVLSIVSFSLIVALSAFPFLHHHELNGEHHRDCPACLIFSAAIVLTAVFVFSVRSPVAGVIRPRSAFRAPTLVARDYRKRAPPFLLS